MSLQVPTYQEFTELKQQVSQLHTELSLYRSLQLNLKYLSREQTKTALRVSETTLHRLKKRNVLTFRKRGRAIEYCVDSVRRYLTSHEIPEQSANDRIIAATSIS